MFSVTFKMAFRTRVIYEWIADPCRQKIAKNGLELKHKNNLALHTFLVMIHV